MNNRCECLFKISRTTACKASKLKIYVEAPQDQERIPRQIPERIVEYIDPVLKALA